MRLRITSTALNAGPCAARCIESVRRQTFGNWTHDYIDAASSDRTHLFAEAARQTLSPLACDGAPDPRVRVHRNAVRRSALENLVPLWLSFDPDDVVVWLDGDDWLASDYALERVEHEHRRGAWVTYGQFVWHDGTLGFAAPCGDAPRREPWRATHLKTFRAGLVRHIRPSDYAGQVLALDRAIMIPALELAGRDRARFIPDVLYVYNATHAWYRTAGDEDLARERAACERVHALPPYARLEDGGLASAA